MDGQGDVMPIHYSGSPTGVIEDGALRSSSVLPSLAGDAEFPHLARGANVSIPAAVTGNCFPASSGLLPLTVSA